jgi:hypothetical protein
MEAIITEFALRYLAEAAKHPEMEHFYSMPSLLIRFYVHNPKDPKIDGYEAAIADMQEIHARGQLKRPTLTESIGSNKEPNFKAIRKSLKESGMVQVVGSKRGQTYGNINARPTLADIIITDIITQLLKSNFGQYRWLDLYTPVFEIIEQIHIKGDEVADKHPEYIPIQGQKRGLEDVMRIESLLRAHIPILDKDITGPVQLDEIGSSKWENAIWPRNFKESDEELEKWIGRVYSEDWFIRSTSNFQRLLKEGNEVISGNGSNGVKRGLWVHSKHIKELSAALSTNFDGVWKLTNDASRLIQALSTKHPLGKHRLEQLRHELRYLSDEIDRRLSDEISK